MGPPDPSESNRTSAARCLLVLSAHISAATQSQPLIASLMPPDRPLPERQPALRRLIDGQPRSRRPEGLRCDRRTGSAVFGLDRLGSWWRAAQGHAPRWVAATAPATNRSRTQRPSDGGAAWHTPPGQGAPGPRAGGGRNAGRVRKPCGLLRNSGRSYPCWPPEAASLRYALYELGGGSAAAGQRCGHRLANAQRPAAHTRNAQSSCIFDSNIPAGCAARQLEATGGRSPGGGGSSVAVPRQATRPRPTSA